jgi:hypothetical protein
MWCTKRGHAPELNFSSSTPEIIRIDLTPFEQAVIESCKYHIYAINHIKIFKSHCFIGFQREI